MDYLPGKRQEAEVIAYVQRQEAEVAAYIEARINKWRSDHPHWPTGEGIPHIPELDAKQIAADAAVYRHGWRQGYRAALSPVISGA